MKKGIQKAFLAIVATGVLAFAGIMLTTSSASANAAACISGGSDPAVCLSVSTGGNPESNQGSGSDGKDGNGLGGGGGSTPYIPPKPPTGYTWNSGIVALNAQGNAAAHYDCAAINAQGGEFKGVWVRWEYPKVLTLNQAKALIPAQAGGRKVERHRLLVTFAPYTIDRGEGVKVTMGTHKVTLKSTCLYSANYTTQDRSASMACIVQATAVIDKISPNSRNLVESTIKSDWGNGNRSLATCNDSALTLGLDSGINEYGRYEGYAKTTKQNVTIKHYTSADMTTGITPPDEITSVSDPYIVHSSKTQLQFTCAGMSREFTGSPSFTMSDCGPGTSLGSPQYQCTFDDPAAPVVKGVSGADVTIFRDGNDNSIDWSRPTIQGDTIGTLETQTRVLRSGTPWNTTGTHSNSKNDTELFSQKGVSMFSSADGTGWSPGINAKGFKFRAFWASDAGAPTVLSPQYMWTGVWRTQTIHVDSVNPVSGEFVFSMVSGSVHSSAMCSGTPVSMNVVRATGG